MLFHWFHARIKDSEQYTGVDFSWTFYFDRVLRICIGHTLKIKFGPYPGKFIFLYIQNGCVNGDLQQCHLHQASKHQLQDQSSSRFLSAAALKCY